MKKIIVLILGICLAAGLFAQNEKIENSYCSWSGISSYLDRGDIYSGIFKDPQSPDEELAIKTAWGAFNSAWSIEGLPHGLISEIFEPAALDNINKGMGMVGNSLALLQISSDLVNGDKLSAMSNSVKSGMFYAIGKWGWKSLKIAGAGLQVFDYMLTSFGNYYVSTKQEALRSAYFEYYEKGSGQRDLKTWRQIIKKLDGEDAIQKEIDAYLEKYFSADALDGPYMTVNIEDNIKTAVKKAYLEERLLPYLKPLFAKLNEEAKEETLDKICDEYKRLVRRLNSYKTYTFHVNGDPEKVVSCQSAIQVMSNGEKSYFVKGDVNEKGFSKLRLTHYSLLVHKVTKARAVLRYKSGDDYKMLYKDIDLKKDKLDLNFDLPADEKEEEQSASENTKTADETSKSKTEPTNSSDDSVELTATMKAVFKANGSPLNIKIKKTKETSNMYYATVIHNQFPKGNTLTIDKTTRELTFIYKLKGLFAPELICRGLPIGPNSYSGMIVTNDGNAVKVGAFSLVLLGN